MERVLTVSQVNGVVKTLLETNAILKRLTISGEICDYRRQVSGHLYFSLKDTGGRIRCVMFKNAAMGLTFIPENGLDVVITGNVSVYEPTGQYQVMVRTMMPAGIGALYQQFEAMKQKLKTMGWFEEAAKKALPEHITRVGIVTSPSGAAIRDMISVIRRRDPSVSILLCPAQVQGEGAATTIADGIKRLCEYGDLDVIIVGRGGGSMEDLWCFNEMPVARAIHEADIPVISAVGHETDFTIADFVADLRAPTPSVAGELVTQDRQVKVQALWNLRQRLTDDISGYLFESRQDLKQWNHRLTLCSPAYQIDKERMDLDRVSDLMLRMVRSKLREEALQLKAFKQSLADKDPRKILSRGYAMVSNGSGRMISSGKDAGIGEELNIIFANDALSVVVKGIGESNG